MLDDPLLPLSPTNTFKLEFTPILLGCVQQKENSKYQENVYHKVVYLLGGFQYLNTSRSRCNFLMNKLGAQV